MHIIARNAVRRARSMIGLIGESQLPVLAERQAFRARGYIISLRDCGLLSRFQYEALTMEAEMALSRARGSPGINTG